MDAADSAQVHEEAFRAASLSTAACGYTGPAPDIVDGMACCAECGEEIPANRLAAIPGVGLCCVCAEELQARRGVE